MHREYCLRSSHRPRLVYGRQTIFPGTDKKTVIIVLKTRQKFEKNSEDYQKVVTLSELSAFLIELDTRVELRYNCFHQKEWVTQNNPFVE